MTRVGVTLVCCIWLVACGGQGGSSPEATGGTAGSSGAGAGAGGVGVGGVGAGGSARTGGSAGTVAGSSGAAGDGMGGSGVGGSAGSGGVSGSGGAGSGGASGMGGSAGSGGSTSGCGVPWTPADVELEERQGRVPMQTVHREMMIAGVARQYLVVVPKDYDANNPYPMIFGFHGSAGDRDQLRAYMNVEQPPGRQAIFVYPSGLPTEMGGDTGWPPGNADDLTFVDTLIAQYTGELCVDKTRIFATGHSYGGIMSHNVGCLRGGVFRAIAPIAGALWGNQACVGQVAVLHIHSPKDTSTAYGSDIGMCTKRLRANTCDENPACGCNWTEELDAPADECNQMAQEPYPTAVTIDVTDRDEKPPVFRQYLNCDPGYPVVFIDHWHREKDDVGNPDERWHNPPPWSGAVVWEFFNNLPPLPAP